MINLTTDFHKSLYPYKGKSMLEHHSNKIVLPPLTPSRVVILAQPSDDWVPYFAADMPISVRSLSPQPKDAFKIKPQKVEQPEMPASLKNIIE